MALGSITIPAAVSGAAANAGQNPQSPIIMQLLNIVGDAAYPTGGSAGFEALVEAALNQGVKVLAVIGQDCGGYVPVYDFAADKLKVFYGDNNNAADGPLIEVPNATDLSGTTFKVLVLAK